MLKSYDLSVYSLIHFTYKLLTQLCLCSIKKRREIYKIMWEQVVFTSIYPCETIVILLFLIGQNHVNKMQ